MFPQGKHKELSIDEVNYDLDNPRIKKFLDMYTGEITAARMYQALAVGLDDDDEKPAGKNSPVTFSSLKASIRTNNGIISPIIINKIKDGKLIVIEGNTRLAIYREFYDNGKKKEWGMIPSIVYDDLDEDSIDAIRLQAHLVGPRPWDPYSKGKYLDYLERTEKFNIDRLADYCGGRKKDVEVLIQSYKDMEKFYRPVIEELSLYFDYTRFSGFVELQSAKIKSSLYRHGYDEGDFAKWLATKIIMPLSDVRWLPKILGNKKAHEKFLKSNTKEAKKLLDQPNIEKLLDNLSVAVLLRLVVTALGSIQYDDLKSYIQDEEFKLVLSDAADEINGLVDDLGKLS